MKRRVMIGLDPGPTQSALVWWDGSQITTAVILPNAEALVVLQKVDSDDAATILAIEKVASFGMPVGMEVFETVFWSGRFAQAFGIERVYPVFRMDVKMHLCHSSRAKDANIRQALIDRFGKVGTRWEPGPLYGIKADLWSALAVAVTAWDQSLIGGQKRASA